MKNNIISLIIPTLLIVFAAMGIYSLTDKYSKSEQIEIYTPENIYYVDLIGLTVNAECWDHELRFKTQGDLILFISEQTAADTHENTREKTINQN